MDIVQVMNLTPNLLTASVHRREVLCRLAYHFVCSLVLYRSGMMALHMGTLGFGNMLIDIAHLLFGVAFLTLNVTLYSDDHLCQQSATP